MQENVILFLSGLICVGWVLELWFKDAPPTWLIKSLAVATFTSRQTPQYSNEDEWLIYANLNLGLLGGLLTCRQCLSQHVSFWGALFLQVFLDSADVYTRCGLFLTCALGWPYLLNIMSSILEKNEY